MVNSKFLYTEPYIGEIIHLSENVVLSNKYGAALTIQSNGRQSWIKQTPVIYANLFEKLYVSQVTVFIFKVVLSLYSKSPILL